jgi:hypothetical protein
MSTHAEQSLNRTAISATLHCLTGCAIGEVLGIASDTLSIATMELIDSLIIIVIPGAIAAGLGDPLFWGSLVLALFVAFWVAVPVNRWLIARGKGHAVVHALHH